MGDRAVVFGRATIYGLVVDTIENAEVCFMKSLLRDVIRRPSNDVLDSVMPDMRPDDPFYAIGDIHGSTSLLTKILEQIAGARQVTGPMVFIGVVAWTPAGLLCTQLANDLDIHDAAQIQRFLPPQV